LRSVVRVNDLARPESLCLLRLSALGDCVNIVPIVHTLRRHWPETRLTWITGAAEARLVGDLPGVEFHVVDKKAGGRGVRALKRELAGRRFDALLHMHASWRANRVGRVVPANLRLGFDAARSRDCQRWFVDRRIGPMRGRHVVDGYFAFLEALGLNERVLDWSLPVSNEASARAAELLPPGPPLLLISPCSSHPRRNWRAERYAAAADHAVERCGMRVALIGGPSATERAMGDAIRDAMRGEAIDLIGRSPIECLVALMERAACLLTPDSGPAHIANAARLPTIALHAATESARSGPHTSLAWCVDRFDAAARRYLGKPAAALPWGTRIKREGVMDLIEVAAVTERLDAIMKEK
jgi:heptosyltransferase I